MEQQPEKIAVQQSGFSITYTVDSFDDGIAFGQHRLEADRDPRDFYSLRLKDESDVVKLRSRYALHKGNPLHELENHLMRLSRQGQLAASTIYLGVSTDPFFPFQGKFDGSMKFLELFQRYTPGMLIVQTRSPLIVIAMPVLKKLGARAEVTIGVETSDEDAVRRYTPGFPRVADRLKTATALRRFGVPVSLQVSPVLPYGDWKKDAANFAALLNDNADRVYVRPLSDGSDRAEREVRGTALAKRLAEDRRFQWLRPDAANPLITELEKISPDKLRVPERRHLKERQVKMFAA